MELYMLLALDTTGNITHFLTLLLIFAFVLAATYYTTRYIAGYQKGRMSRSNMSIIEAVRLSSDKYLELVKIGQGYYVISVCKNNISLICKVPEEELILNTGESPEGEGQETAKKSFAEILTSLKDLGKR